MQSYKCVLVTAVIYSVIMGSIYIALSVLAILARNHTFDMTGSPLMYMLYLLYFRLDEFSPLIRWDYLRIAPPTVDVIIPDETQATYRTFIFSLVYLSLYGALVFTALYALCGIKNSCLGRKSFLMFFMPWIFVNCSILVMDVLATAFYIMDSIATLSADGLMELLEVENPAQVGGAFEQLSVQWRTLPPVIMFLGTSKCFFFLIVDIIIITLITRAGWAASNYHKYVDDTVRMYSQNMSRSNPGFETSQTDIKAQKQHPPPQMEFMHDQASQVSTHEMKMTTTSAPQQPETPNRYNDTSVQAFVYPDRNNYKRDDRQQQTREQRPTKQQRETRPMSLALTSKLNDQPGQVIQNGSVDQRDLEREIENRMSQYTSSNGNVIRSVVPLKDDDVPDKQQQRLGVRVLPPVSEINRNSSIAKARPQVPPKPFNPNRASKHLSGVEQRLPDNRNASNKVDRNSSINAPEELRGQLPWSYFKARDDIPKKAFTELNEDEELPPVPIPDYTLHFPKSKRVNLSSDSDNEGSWSHYEQRY